MTTLIKKIPAKIKSSVKKPTHFYLRILSRHHTISPLRNKILIKGGKVVYRHGSSTKSDFEYEINSVESINNSADKKLMKEAFDKAEIHHAPWIHMIYFNTDKKKWDDFLAKLSFGKDKESWIIIKNRWGSRGGGNYLAKTMAELNKFIEEKKKSLENYIVEEYKNYSVEYRIHATEYGYFYTCRKMLKSDTPKDQRFQRHDDNCSWFLEDNPSFNKPENWNEIVEDCKKAVVALGADVLAFDIKCTSIKDSKDKKCRFVILESASAPSMGKVTLEKYETELSKIINHKYDL